MPLHKQMVSLTEPQIAWLKIEAKRLGVSVSDLIRRIIDEHRAAAGDVVRMGTLSARSVPRFPDDPPS